MLPVVPDTVCAWSCDALPAEAVMPVVADSVLVVEAMLYESIETRFSFRSYPV